MAKDPTSVACTGVRRNFHPQCSLQLVGMYEHVIDSTKKMLTMAGEEQTKFRCCGADIQQYDDFSIKVTCEQTSLKLGLINVFPEGAEQVESNVTHTERDQLMSVMWHRVFAN